MGFLTDWDSDAKRAVDVEISPWATLLAGLSATLLSLFVLRWIRGRRAR